MKEDLQAHLKFVYSGDDQERVSSLPFSSSVSYEVPRHLASITVQKQRNPQLVVFWILSVNKQTVSR